MARKKNPNCENCPKCVYRGRTAGELTCDYSSINDRIRGGKPEDCDKFLEGDPIGGRKAINLQGSYDFPVRFDE